jgi:hypothetical protein
VSDHRSLAFAAPSRPRGFVAPRVLESSSR